MEGKGRHASTEHRLLPESCRRVFRHNCAVLRKRTESAVFSALFLQSATEKQIRHAGAEHRLQTPSIRRTMVQSDHSFPSRFSSQTDGNSHDYRTDYRYDADDSDSFVPPIVPARLVVTPSAPSEYSDDMPTVVVPAPRIVLHSDSPPSFSDVSRESPASFQPGYYDASDGNLLRRRNVHGSSVQQPSDVYIDSTVSSEYELDRYDPFYDRQDDDDDDESKRTTLVASGAAGAVLGMLVGGPFFGVVTGFGTAYASTQPKGTSAGDIGRAMADIAILTHHKAVQIDRKHRLVARLRVRLMEGWEYAKKLDREHHIAERFRQFVVWSIKTTIELANRHRLLERGARATGSGIRCITGSGRPSDTDAVVQNGNGTVVGRRCSSRHQLQSLRQIREESRSATAAASSSTATIPVRAY